MRSASTLRGPEDTGAGGALTVGGSGLVTMAGAEPGGGAGGAAGGVSGATGVAGRAGRRGGASLRRPRRRAQRAHRALRFVQRGLELRHLLAQRLELGHEKRLLRVLGRSEERRVGKEGRSRW